MGLDWYGVALLLILMVGGALVAQQFGLIPTGSAPGTDINVTVSGSGTWDPSWNTTVVQIVSGLNLSAGDSGVWNSSWNTVVEGLIAAENLTDWNGAWNSTVTDIILNHAFSSLNATNLFGTNYYLGNRQLGFVAPYSFIINVTGSTYNAWHGANSTLFMSSTNASQVFEQVVGANRTILVKNGDYGSNIVINILATMDNLDLVAETKEGVVFSQSNKSLSIINLLGTSINTLNNVVIDGFKLVGAGSVTAGSQSGIYMTYSAFCTVQNNRLEDMSSDESTNGIAAILLYYSCFNNTITRNTILGGTFEGIGNAGGWNNEISFNHISNTRDNCIDINGNDGTYAKNNRVISNYLEGGSTGITVDGGCNSVFSDNVIVSPKINGLAFGGQAENNTISNNVVSNVVSTSTALAFENAHYNTVNGLTTINCGYSVIINTNSWSNAINDINSIQCVNYAIFINGVGCDYNSITGGQIIRPAGQGINLNAVNYTRITGITILNSTNQGITFADSLYTSITSCTISGCGWTSVDETGTSDYTLLIGNILNANEAVNTVDATNSSAVHNIGTG